MNKKLFIFSVLILQSSVLFAVPKYPTATGYVTDTAGIIDASSKNQLEQSIADFERTTSNELAVVTVPSLEGETVETYAVTLFKQWGIGKKGKDNGILILVAVQDRKMRIEVGYGLESILPDGLCGQIIRDNMTPAFRRNAYGEGLLSAVQAIRTVLSGGALPQPSQKQRLPGIVFGLLKTFGLPLLFLFLAFPCTTIGGLFAAFVYFTAVGPLRYLCLLALPFGIIVDILQFMVRKRAPGHWGGIYNFSRGRYIGGGFTGGGFGGGGFTGGGFGGGSSGGGGASGGW